MSRLRCKIPTICSGPWSDGSSVTAERTRRCGASVASSRTSVAATAIEKTPTVASVAKIASAMRPLRSFRTSTTLKPEIVSPYLVTRRYTVRPRGYRGGPMKALSRKYVVIASRTNDSSRTMMVVRNEASASIGGADEYDGEHRASDP